MLERVQEKGKPLALLMGMQINIATMQNIMKNPEKTENKTTI